MILIVEGPDGAGKTTFARGFGGAYRHEGPPPTDLGPGNLLRYYLDKVRDAAQAPPFGTVVFDRLALGELVYGPILRGRSRLTEADYRVFRSETTRKHGAVHVLCIPPLETCLRNWEGRRGSEYIGDRGVFEATHAAFMKLRSFVDLVHDYTFATHSMGAR